MSRSSRSEPAQGRAAAGALPGPCRRVPRALRRRALARAASHRHVRRARRIIAALGRGRSGRRPPAPAQQRPDRRSGGGLGARRRRAVHPDALRHGDLALPPARRSSIRSRARIRTPRRVTFYSSAARERASSSASIVRTFASIYPAVSDSFVAARRGGTRRSGGSDARHRRAARRAQRQAPARAGRPAAISSKHSRAIAAGGRDVRLVICGTGPLRATLEAQARAMGVADA